MSNKIQRVVWVALAAVMALSMTACAPVLEQMGYQPKTINVSGRGEVRVRPDLATVYVGVQTTNENVSTALTESNTKAQAIVDALTNLGVAAEDIQTSSFNIYPQPQYDPQTGQQTSTAYMVDNSVNVTVRDLSRLGELLDTVIRTGANSINGISFDVTNKQEAIEQARELAVADAQQQATDLAAAAGVKLGGLRNISIYNSTGSTPVYEGKGGMYSSAASTVPISAGQLIISVDASATFDIK